MKQLLLCFIAALLLMPSPLMADNAKKKIKTLDITMDMPTADMDLNAGEELALKSVQTAYGDLFKSGVISLMSISWDGEFGENSDEIPTFKAGFPYIATIQLLIDPSSNYQTDYKTINGDFVLSPDNFKVTINGKATRLLKDCAPYVPIVTLSFTVPGGKPGPQNKEIPFLEYNEYKSEFRSTLPYVSRKEADELNPALHSFDVLVMDRPYKFKELMYDKSFTTSSGHSYKKHNMLFISKIIIDVSNRADNNNVSEFTDLLGSMFSDIVNLKEVWLSSKVDIIKYIRDLHKATVNPVFPQYRQYEEQSFTPPKAHSSSPSKQPRPCSACLPPTQPSHHTPSAPTAATCMPRRKPEFQQQRCSLAPSTPSPPKSRQPTACASTRHASVRSSGIIHAAYAANANTTKRTPSVEAPAQNISPRMTCMRT